MTELDRLAKQRVALRYWLLGRGFHRAADAMSYAEAYHQGSRRGGAPEFSHQIAIASHVRTYAPSLRHAEETIVAALLHDVREDYGVGDDEIRARFGDRVADAVDALTKEFRGIRREEAVVFAAIGADPIASVVKGADRVHNQSTLAGVFRPEKVAEYVAETREWILPMLRRARRDFSDQEPVYEGIGLVLRTQIDLLEAWQRPITPSA